ncbi:MAG: hypothetical protein LBJ72_12930 [Dysgonamonadaceae bacterium]|jgi:PKD repeat protein|nr:hypothetical protein [Dysgonamonadaceae bacterium]
MIKIHLYCIGLLSLVFVSCRQEQAIPVEVDFSCHTSEDHTSPLVVTIVNNTNEADEYLWTFEGGEPASSGKKNPGNIIFNAPGEHTIMLEAWNPSDRKSKTAVVRVDSAVVLDFKAEAEINNYAPAQFRITNLSSGGTHYIWTFEGGEPAAYEGINPPAITYSREGVYIITLNTGNGSSGFILNRDITVRKPLDASFSIVPSFEDEDDMEAPLRATFDTYLQSVETLLWECEGAEISDKTSPRTGILFHRPGAYTVFLNASNGKQEKRISQEITVNPNTNLRTHRNIRFGVNTAQASVGAVYSTRLRRGFKSVEINDVNGPEIDVAFLGLNVNFIYNRFISPGDLSDTPLTVIPGAKATRFINRQEKYGSGQLTAGQFESMTTDVFLRQLSFVPEPVEFNYFSGSPLPRVVLFETFDGRKGAILVKEIILNGVENSHILTDIKIQKND